MRIDAQRSSLFDVMPCSEIISVSLGQNKDFILKKNYKEYSFYEKVIG